MPADVLSRALAAPARLLAQAPEIQVEETFQWLRMPALWVVVLIVVPLVVGYVAFFYRREVPAGGSGWRWILGALRVLVILSLLAMLAQPVMRRTTYETRDSTIAILVDDSLSMDVADRYSERQLVDQIATFFGSTSESIESTTRYDLIRRLFSDDVGLLEKLREKAKVVVSTFAGSVQEQAELARLRDDDSGAALTLDEILPAYEKVREDSRVQETRIGESLRDAVAAIVGSGFGEGEERVSGLLLITDGQENAGSGSTVEIARRLGERGTPVQVIGVGNPDDPKDVRIVGMDVDEIVLVDDIVPVDAFIVSDGFEDERVTVRLSVDSRVADTADVVLAGDGKRQIERLEFRPQRPGEYTVTVEVDKLGGEVFYDNNSASKTIRVLDEKIKVLYLEYLPRWEYRYLKNALVRDPAMEAQVWLFSADPEFVQESSASTPPLTRFPTERSELLEYHVIVIGDVPPESIGDEAMAVLKDFVYEGGGVVFIAGRHADPSQYLHTDLYALIPVEVPEPDRFGFAAAQPVTDPWKVELTPEGAGLSVMRLDNDPERNRFLWESRQDQVYSGLPSFFWYAKTGAPKANAVVLARHPSDEIPNESRGRVVFSYMNYGKGRTFLSAVDNTWRWRAGVENRYFARFWGQVVRFVATGRLLGKTPRFSVTTDKMVYNLGETVRVDARVYDANLKPLDEPSVTLYHELQGREGEPPERVELSLNEVKGPGSYEGLLSASFRGRHDIWLGSESERLAFQSYTVEIPALESRDPKLDRPHLEKIASASGGQYHDLHRAFEAVEKLQGISRSQEGLVENDDLWDEWWILLLFTALICCEWILRKVVRLP